MATRSSVLNFLLCISIQTTALAIGDLELQERETFRYLPSRQYWTSCLVPVNPHYNADRSRPNKREELIEGFNSLLPKQNPFMPGFHAYYQSEEGKMWVAIHRMADGLYPPVTMKLFDAGESRTNFIIRGPDFNFSFTYTQHSVTETRKHPSLNFSIPRAMLPFRGSTEQPQEGHGGDQADSRDGMAYERIDFMPQYKVPNEKIRNPQVRYQIRKKGGVYAEYAIAAHNSPLTMDETFIPEAYLFLSYTHDKLDCFLYPNYPETYYAPLKKRLPKTRKGGKEESTYLKYMDLFRTDLGSKVNLEPLVMTSHTSEEEIETRINKNFHTADAIVRGRLALVPPEKQEFYPPQVVRAFNYRMALFLYEQAASIEEGSISRKLSLVEKFAEDLPPTSPEISFFQPQLARFWLSVSDDQVQQSVTSLTDKVELFTFHSSAHELIEGDAIHKLQDRKKAKRIRRQILSQSQDELLFEEDVDTFMSLVDQVPQSSIHNLSATFFCTLSHILSEVYQSYGADDPDLFGLYSGEDAREFAEEWLEMDEEDRELVDTISEAKGKILEIAADDTVPTQEELDSAVKSLQKMEKDHDRREALSWLQ